MVLVQSICRSNEQWTRELEKRIDQLVKENSETRELASKRSQELDRFKRESVDLTKRLEESQENLRVLDKKHSEHISKNKGMKEDREAFLSEKAELEEKVRKLNELLQVTRNELKNSRQLIEEKNDELATLEEEIQYFEANFVV